MKSRVSPLHGESVPFVIPGQPGLCSTKRAFERPEDVPDYIQALEKDDLVAAANHYRLAVQCTDDPAVHAAFAETEAKAKGRVHDASLAQARGLGLDEIEAWIRRYYRRMLLPPEPVPG